MIQHRLTRRIALLLTPLLLIASFVLSSAPAPLGASSHREAPLIASDPDADTTDVYAFISPERTDSVTIIANYIPLEWPEGGPNYHKFSDDVLYEIHVDNTGDGKSHIKYQFEFTTTTQNPNTFLYNTGTISSLSDNDWNVRQTYSIKQVSLLQGIPNTTTLASNLISPPVNIGSKSTPNYETALAMPAVHTIGTGPTAIKVFAGQRDDPFFVDLGSVFDLLSLRGQASPIGYPTGPKFGLDGLAGYNTHSIAIQVPIASLFVNSLPGETVIGVWATSSRRSTRVLSALGGVQTTGEYVQISRLGMPLTNEVVMPRALKDAFNGLKPEQDNGLFNDPSPTGRLLASSVLTPELQTLLGALYGVPNPGKPRTDILEIFLTGIKTGANFTINTAAGPVTLPPNTNVNQHSISLAIQPAEMLRLNTAPPFRPGTTGSLCATTPNYALGILGGDACGFPNGRRLQDDVTDIELLAVGGAAWTAVTGDTTFNFNTGLIPVLRDSVNGNDKDFSTTFPYLASPHQGQDHRHSQIYSSYMALLRAEPATAPRYGGERTE